MADIGECLDTAGRIDAADANSWPEEWLGTAERVRKMAENSLAKGHERSAGEAYLRAANYYRAALIHHPEPGPGVLQAGRQSVACFDRALELLAVPARPVRIPYEDTTLPGYFFPLARRTGRGARPDPPPGARRVARGDHVGGGRGGQARLPFSDLSRPRTGNGASESRGLPSALTGRRSSPRYRLRARAACCRARGHHPHGVEHGVRSHPGRRVREADQDLHRGPRGLELGRAMYEHFEGYGLLRAPRGCHEHSTPPSRTHQCLADSRVVVQGRRLEARRHLLQSYLRSLRTTTTKRLWTGSLAGCS